VLDDLFTMGPLSSAWNTPTIYFMLPLFALLQVGLTAFSLGLPIPAGLVTPIFIAGAAAGRLVGEIIKDTSGIETIHPASYAVVGAAALTSGVTRTLATSIVVFELTGQMSLLLPVLLVVLISITVASFFSPSIYDIQLQMKGLPYMPPFKPHGKRTARDLMKAEVTFVTIDSNFHNLETVLRNSSVDPLPLVETKDTRYLMGVIPRKRLERLLLSHEKVYEKLRQDYEDALDEYERSQNAAEEPSQPAADLLGGIEEISTSAIKMEKPAPPVVPPSREEFWAQKLGLSRETPGFDPCPFSTFAETPLSKLHFMFAMLGLSHALVLERGRLVGVITKKDMMTASREDSLIDQ
jgi:chloride channel 2